MKKTALILMILTMAFALTAYGCDSSEDGGNDSASTTNSSNASSSYETYDDLSLVDYTYNLDTSERVYYNYPSWRKNEVAEGCSITNDSLYDIIISENYENPY